MCIVIDVGTLPDGVYNRNTRIYFCCRNDGPADLPIVLPTTVPFYLLKFGDQCQQVCACLDYLATAEYFKIMNYYYYY